MDTRATMMLPLWLLATAMCALYATTAGASPIVGGEPANNMDIYPFMASLQVRNIRQLGTDEATANATHTANDLNHFCGAVYLKKGFLLTAAHCVWKMNATKHEIYAVIGALNLRSTFGKSVRKYRVKEIIAKQYDPYTYDDDIALMRVDTSEHGEPVRLDQMVDLPAANNAADGDGGAQCSLIGYGSTRISGSPTMKLHVGPNARITAGECAAKLGQYMAPQPGAKMFCAEGRNAAGQPVDACQGDSGGPYLCRRPGGGGAARFVAVGLTSYGAGCGVPNTPGVYTEIGGHADWIRGVMASGIK